LLGVLRWVSALPAASAAPAAGTPDVSGTSKRPPRGAQDPTPLDAHSGRGDGPPMRSNKEME
jgi:hypothetical protein